jgi:hypothetical protein
MKYISTDIVNIKPLYKDVNILYITKEDWINGNKMMSNPAIWIEYDGWLYYGICTSYHFSGFEEFEDWDSFNQYRPGEYEFSVMMGLNPTFYKLDYVGVMNSDLDYWTKFELDFIKKWWRDKQINDVLK